MSRMGIDIDRTTFSESDYSRFQDRLADNLCSLKSVLGRPGFGQGQASIGAELELYIVDNEGRPLLINEQILHQAQDPLLTPELNRYNLEYNLAPLELAGKAFSALEVDISQKLLELNKLAAEHGGRMAMCGILPTLKQDDFGPACMTNRNRYHALVKRLIERRGSQFRIDIDGEDPLQLEMSDVTLEGANTSFQLHYRVDPKNYADTYNAFQLVTPLVLGIAANSASLFGHLLWQETRIPLFKQSIDTRNIDAYSWHPPPRVNFGNGWVRQGAYELFEEAVRTYVPLLPLCADEKQNEGDNRHDAPVLPELNLHLGSVWSWNRPVYDHHDKGHLRIESRALPAGPTPVDMVANAVLLIGLSEALREQVNELLPALPFYLAEYNFYRAAQHGLQARLIWPSTRQHSCEERTLAEILLSLLPSAKQALLSIGIDKADVEHYLGVIEARLGSGQTGASWQRRSFTNFFKHHSRTRAMHKMLESMMMNAASKRPVHEWPLSAD